MRRVLRLGAKYSPEYDRPAMSQLRRNGALSRVSRQRQRIRPVYLAARQAIWQVEDLELTSTKTSAGDCIVDHIFYGLFHETILSRSNTYPVIVTSVCRAARLPWRSALTAE